MLSFHNYNHCLASLMPRPWGLNFFSSLRCWALLHKIHIILRFNPAWWTFSKPILASFRATCRSNFGLDLGPVILFKIQYNLTGLLVLPLLVPFNKNLKCSYSSSSFDFKLSRHRYMLQIRFLHRWLWTRSIRRLLRERVYLRGLYRSLRIPSPYFAIAANVISPATELTSHRSLMNKTLVTKNTTAR